MGLLFVNYTVCVSLCGRVCNRRFRFLDRTFESGHSSGYGGGGPRPVSEESTGVVVVCGNGSWDPSFKKKRG